MARIIDLGALVAEDIVFKYAGTDYAIPGDIDVETVFRLFDAFTQVTSIEDDDPAKVAETVKDRFENIRTLVFDLLKVRQPKIETYPFGIRGTGVVLQTILAELGVNASPENPTPTPPKKTVPKKKPAARRAR